MVPIKKVEDLIKKHSNLEKELSSGNVDKKLFAEKSKEYSDLNEIIKEIKDRLIFLNKVGLNYLSLSRASKTLSGGESQRIRLASQIGLGLTGVLYVLDEPSIGLHQKDNKKLI